MRLDTLIENLEAFPAETVTTFGGLHSYRGYYDELALDPSEESTVAEVLADAKEALGGRAFTGYKGGEFVMEPYTAVWLAMYGSTGDGIAGFVTKGGKLDAIPLDVSDYV